MTIEALKWKVAGQLNRLPGQCWADLVMWVLHRYRDDPDWRTAMPWRPMREGCRKDAEQAGRCYCGKLGSDGTTLGYGEYVCVTRMPGRTDRLCSRPGGHDGMHQCGSVEWGSIHEGAS